jgi:hypothetical protein
MRRRMEAPARHHAQVQSVISATIAQRGVAATKPVLGVGVRRGRPCCRRSRLWSAVAAAAAFRSRCGHYPYALRFRKSGSCCDRTPKRFAPVQTMTCLKWAGVVAPHKSQNVCQKNKNLRYCNADLHPKVCGFVGSGRAGRSTRGLAGRAKNGSADCGSIAFRFPSMCIRVFKAEKPRTLNRRSALLAHCIPSRGVVQNAHNSALCHLTELALVRPTP